MAVKNSDVIHKGLIILRILIVDDNKYAIEVIKDYLKISNVDVDVHSANNGKDAIKKIDENVYELILLDISMPDMSGIDVLKHIRLFDREVPVIIVSVVSTEYQIDSAFREGVDEFLVKPVDMEKLIGWINKVNNS